MSKKVIKKQAPTVSKVVSKTPKKKTNTTMVILDSNSKDYAKVVKSLRDLTPDKVLEDDSIPSISRILKKGKISEKQIETIIARMIEWCSVFVGDAMPAIKCQYTAIELLSTYPYTSLKLEEIYLICQYIKSADNFGKLTPNKFMSSVKKFWKDREQRAIGNSLNHSQANKSNANLDERIHKSLSLPDHMNNKISRSRAYNNKKYLK